MSQKHYFFEAARPNVRMYKTPRLERALAAHEELVRRSFGSYIALSDEQMSVLRRHIQGCPMWDLGCGIGLGSSLLLDAGATSVDMVDPIFERAEGRGLAAGIEALFAGRMRTHAKRFEDVVGEHIPNCLTSWPENTSRFAALTTIVKRVPGVVVYVGKNYDGMCCGRVDFWEEVSQREILAMVPEYRNTLIVYGPKRVKRNLVFEEHSGLTMMNQREPYYWEDIMGVRKS